MQEPFRCAFNHAIMQDLMRAPRGTKVDHFAAGLAAGGCSVWVSRSKDGSRAVPHLIFAATLGL